MKYVVMCNRCLQDWNQLKIFNFPFLKNSLESTLYHDCSLDSIVEKSLKFLSKLIFFLRNWRKCWHNESKYTAALCPLLELQCCLPYVVHSSNPQCESQLRHITVINCYCVTTLFQINMGGKKNNLDLYLQSILTSHEPLQGVCGLARDPIGWRVRAMLGAVPPLGQVQDTWHDWLDSDWRIFQDTQ